MRVRHDGNPRSNRPAFPVWFVPLPVSAIARAPLGRAARRRALPIGRRSASSEPTEVTWRCARCGAVAPSIDAASRHIATAHSADPLPAWSKTLRDRTNGPHENDGF